MFRRLKGRATPVAMNTGKSVVGAVCFAVLLLATTGAIWPANVSAASFLWLALSGIVGLAVCDTFLLRAMLEIGPRRAQVAMCLNPVVVFLVALLPPWSQTSVLSRPWPWVGLALALAGISMAARDAPDAPAADRHARRRGFADALVAAVCNAAGVLLARLGIAAGASPVDSSYVRLAVAAVALVAGALVLRRFGAWTAGLRSPTTRVPLAAAAFLGTFLGIGFSQAGIAWAKSTGAATTINALAPVWLIPLSSWFLGERHTRGAWISTVLAVAGVAILAL